MKKKKILKKCIILYQFQKNTKMIIVLTLKKIKKKIKLKKKIKKETEKIQKKIDKKKNFENYKNKTNNINKSFSNDQLKKLKVKEL
jgi:hypothetical protein